MDLDVSDDEKNIKKVRVKFVTKDPAIRVTETPIAVPESLQRYGLSEVVNHLLGRDPPTPFDMIVLGHFLRSSLASVMRKNVLSGESVLEVEYMPALRQPTEAEHCEQPDWVSAVAVGSRVGGKRTFVTGCYDGCLRVYGTDCKLTSNTKAHQSPVTALCAIPAAGSNEDKMAGFLSGSKDMTARLWKSAGSGSNASLEPAAVLRGHTNSVSAAYASGAAAYTGDWDGHVCIWDVAAVLDSDKNNGNVEAVKRRKGEEGARETSMREMKATANFRAHAQTVTGLAGIGAGEAGAKSGTGAQTLYSASLDRAIKTWDAERQDCVHTLNAPKAVTCLGCSSSGRMLATGHPDARVRIWDTRAQGETLTRASLASHKQWVTAVAWAPGSETMVISCGHDGALKLWDIRATVPLHSAQAHEGKALCCGWLDSRILSGGTDGEIKTYLIPDKS